MSRISTIWTMVLKANDGDAATKLAAQTKVFEIYSGAIHRYLCAVLRDSDAADEVFQEFAVQLVRGGFRWADPSKGRFRDYLKVSVLRLANDYRKRRQRQDLRRSFDKGELEAAVPIDPKESDRVYLLSLQQELLERTWSRLAQYDSEHDGSYHSVLGLKAQHPEMRSADLAAELTRRLQRHASPLTAVGVRKLLQRSREKFAELLIDEVAESLGDQAEEAVEQELAELQLLPYCEFALKRRSATDSGQDECRP